MTLQSISHVPTRNGSRYLQQLCKHWSHSLTVEFSPQRGTVTFPKSGRSGDWPADGRLVLEAHDNDLECRIEASAPGQLEALKTVVARHLDRFAFREAPLTFDWQDRPKAA